MIHRLKAEDKLGLFKKLVTKAIATTYFDVIKEPMDLSSVQAKVLANKDTRANFRDIRDDFDLMCLNAVTFNSKERGFLIWREAWRYYGQGRRILRQTAPKSPMKHRGGKYYDALVAAVKRQMPNTRRSGRRAATSVAPAPTTTRSWAPRTATTTLTSRWRTNETIRATKLLGRLMLRTEAVAGPQMEVTRPALEAPRSASPMRSRPRTARVRSIFQASASPPQCS